jgi:hypothetical protein
MEMCSYEKLHKLSILLKSEEIMKIIDNEEERERLMNTESKDESITIGNNTKKINDSVSSSSLLIQ